MLRKDQTWLVFINFKDIENKDYLFKETKLIILNMYIN